MFFQLLCSEIVVQCSDYFGNLIIVQAERGPVFCKRKPGPSGSKSSFWHAFDSRGAWIEWGSASGCARAKGAHFHLISPPVGGETATRQEPPSAVARCIGLRARSAGLTPLLAGAFFHILRFFDSPFVIMICWLHAEQEPEADVGGDDGGHGENVTKRPPFIVRRIPWRSCCNTADIDPEMHDHGWLRGC